MADAVWDDRGCRRHRDCDFDDSLLFFFLLLVVLFCNCDKW